MLRPNKTAPAARTLDLPTLVDFEDWSAATTRTTELQAEKAKLRDELKVINERRRDGTFDHTHSQRIDAIIAGRALPQTTADTERAAEIHARLRDLDVAIEALHTKTYAAQRKASASVCEKVRPAFDKIVSEMTVALNSFHKANIRYRALLDEVEAAGFNTTSLPDVASARLHEHPKDFHSLIAYWFRNAIEVAAIKKGDAPAEFVWGK